MPRRLRCKRRHIAKAVYRRPLVTAVLVALVVVPSLTTAIRRARSTTQGRAETRTAASTRAVSDTPIEASTATNRRRTVFPYSVIPGGVNSVDELQKVIALDPVVADHYRSFDLSQARIERLTAPRFAHVSYRVGEHVYWTRRPLVISAGERVITDGKNIARTRCGNQIASQPGETLAAEPSEHSLDTPSAPVEPCPSASTTCAPLGLPVLPFGPRVSAPEFVPPPAGLAAPIGPPPLIVTPSSVIDPSAVPTVSGTPADDPPADIPGGSGTNPTLNPSAPVPVPEPSSVILMLTGGGGFLIRWLTVKRRAEHSNRS